MYLFLNALAYKFHCRLLPLTTTVRHQRSFQQSEILRFGSNCLNASCVCRFRQDIGSAHGELAEFVLFKKDFVSFTSRVIGRIYTRDDLSRPDDLNTFS